LQNEITGRIAIALNLEVMIREAAPANRQSRCTRLHTPSPCRNVQAAVA
jgi:hypothetical protein